jgi:hypothetical protein
MAEFIVRDLRRPGERMQALALKLPAEQAKALQAQADRLHVNRGALARALLLQGLEQLEQQHTISGQP